MTTTTLQSSGKGCAFCGGWGGSLHLAALRVLLRKYDAITAAGPEKARR